MNKAFGRHAGQQGRDLPDLPSPVPPHLLDSWITPQRAARYRQVLARRTGLLVVVLENVDDPQNATAVTRSCDAFGISRLHIITQQSPFRINRRTSGGVHHYVDIRTHPNVEEAYNLLRQEGFRIMVADLVEEGLSGPQQLEAMQSEGPLAVVFGSEHSGLSPTAREQADGFFSIPMVGFCQSLNLSVSVAVTLYTLRQKAVTEAEPGDLSPQEQKRLYDAWVRGYRGEAARQYLERRDGRDNDPLDVYGIQPERQT